MEPLISKMNELTFNLMLLAPLPPLFGTFEPVEAELTFKSRSYFCYGHRLWRKSRVRGLSIERLLQEMTSRIDISQYSRGLGFDSRRY
jgi:hypothetical protein